MQIRAWLAIVAMALNALWPLIVQARPATLVPVCTVGGTTHYIELPGGSTPVDSHQGHCAFCVTAVALPAQPPVQGLHAFSFSTPEATSFSVRSVTFISADARAPPVLS
jgi:hypothetical protein